MSPPHPYGPAEGPKGQPRQEYGPQGVISSPRDLWVLELQDSSTDDQDNDLECHLLQLTTGHAVPTELQLQSLYKDWCYYCAMTP